LQLEEPLDGRVETLVDAPGDRSGFDDAHATSPRSAPGPAP
jgi:hypothetical protein